MGTTAREIEIDGDFIEVEFEGSPTVENDGIGPYEYWGYKCFDKGEDYQVLEELDYDKSLYSKEQNDIIERYIDDNFKSISESIIENHNRD